MSDPTLAGKQLERCAGAVIRASAERPQLDYRPPHFLYEAHQPMLIPTPHLWADVARDDLAYFRGAADGIALRFKHSDAELHQSLLPEDDFAQQVFDLFEQLRVESLADNDSPGTQRNLQYTFQHWCDAFVEAQLAENEIGLIFVTVALWARNYWCQHPIDEGTEILIEGTRVRLGSLIGRALLDMRKLTQTQAAFAKKALEVIQALAPIIKSLDKGPANSSQAARVARFSYVSRENSHINLKQTGNQYHNTPQRIPPAQIQAQLSRYQIYDDSFDRECHIDALCKEKKQREHRTLLDEYLKSCPINVRQLTHQLRRLLQRPHEPSWAYAKEEGYLDARRLAQVATNPNYSEAYKQLYDAPQCDASVCFVLDNSGSMKRQPLEGIVAWVDTLCRALELAGAKTEVLGFSTNAHSGGRLHRQWVRKGRPDNPGRLNERLHVVYKTYERRYRRARLPLAGLLETQHYREGFDGEALLWAHERLLAQRSARKVLIMVTDGPPRDSATINANDWPILDQHLRDAIHWVSSLQQVDLISLGIGLDVTDYFRRGIMADFTDGVHMRHFNLLLSELSALVRR